jgi:hypothetical protein
MWGLIILFVLVTPGILFTVPRIGKTKLLAVCVHALIFVVLARWLRVTEGFKLLDRTVTPAPLLNNTPVTLSDETKDHITEYKSLIQKGNELSHSFDDGNIDQDSYFRQYYNIITEVNAIKTTLNSDLLRDVGDFSCDPGTHIVYPIKFLEFFGYSLGCKTCPSNYYCPGGVSLYTKCPSNNPVSPAGAKSKGECKRKQPLPTFPIFNAGDKVICGAYDDGYTVVDKNAATTPNMRVYTVDPRGGKKIKLVPKVNCKLVIPEVLPELASSPLLT